MRCLPVLPYNHFVFSSTKAFCVQLFEKSFWISLIGIIVYKITKRNKKILFESDAGGILAYIISSKFLD